MNNTWEGKHGPLLIAEIGGNHEGDFEYAKKLTQLAIDSDVDFVKFQLYSGDSLVNPVVNPIRNKHFKKFELSQEQYIELANMCESGGVNFMASVWNTDYIEWVDKYSKIYKIGSGDFTAFDVIKGFAKTKKPLLLSSGVSSMEDVRRTMKFVQSLDPIYSQKSHLGLLQCTSMYPIPPDDANLSVMMEYKKEFNAGIGYSDHTEGSYALEIAVAMGAEILEFHFTDSREGKEFRDHKVSLTRDEVHELINKISIISRLKGSPIKTPLEVEGEHVTTFRRAVYFKKDMKKGEVVKKEHLVTLRPNKGIDAREYESLIGKVLKSDINKHEIITIDKFN